MDCRRSSLYTSLESLRTLSQWEKQEMKPSLHLLLLHLWEYSSLKFKVIRLSDCRTCCSRKDVSNMNTFTLVMAVPYESEAAALPSKVFIFNMDQCAKENVDQYAKEKVSSHKRKTQSKSSGEPVQHGDSCVDLVKKPRRGSYVKQLSSDPSSVGKLLMNVLVCVLMYADIALLDESLLSCPFRECIYGRFKCFTHCH